MGTARAQGYVEIIRGGTTTTSTVGISNAISLMPGGLQSGDIVLIQGLENAGGAPKGYSTATTNESFPITIPAGVTVKARDSVPVYVVVDSGSNAATIFELAPAAGAVPVTRLEKLNLGGAERAVKIQTGAGETADVILDKVRFGRNNTAVYAKAAGGLIQIQVKDCKIVDGAPLVDPIPLDRKFSKGLDFQAEDPEGRVEATVDNLQIFGLFPASQMLPVPYSRTQRTHDMEAYGTEITRLIEIFADSDSNVEGEHDDQNLNVILPVPQVHLTVNASTLGGAGIQAECGWDVGLYADTDSTGATVYDYLSLWDATFNGCTIRAFRLAGIYGEATTETRGSLRLNQVSIEDTGMTSAAETDQQYRSGVHLVTEESYIAFEADNCAFNDNRGHGAYLMSASSIQAGDLEFPTGLYLDLDHCAMHGNSLSGLFLDGAPDKAHWAHNTQGAIVGGTYDYFPKASAERSLIWEGNEPDPRLPRGQGVVNGCEISNNGEYGVFVRQLGTHANAAACASTRFVNTYVWNNPFGGFYARLEPFHLTPTIAPGLFTPLVHCTFAYNHTGGASGWSAEIHPVDVGSGPPARLFKWEDHPGTDNPAVLGTSINNCVFQRASSTDPDFGLWLDFLDQFDDNTPLGSYWISQADLIPWAGIRGYTTDVFAGTVDSRSTFDPSPFLGPVLPSSRQSNQFFLDNNATAQPLFFQSWPYLRAGYSLTEDSQDIEGFQRPTLVDRDKGGEED